MNIKRFLKFNSIEHTISNYLNTLPGLKKYIKYFYQGFWNLIPVSRIIKVTYDIIGPRTNTFHCFGGYYDIIPENKNGFIFQYEVDNDQILKFPNKKSYCYISIYAENKLIGKVKTYAFNLQQGSRAVWAGDCTLYYNDYCESLNDYTTRSLNIETMQSFEISKRPIQTLIDDNKFLSICYKCLFNYRKDYAYFAHKHNGLCEHADSVTLVDLKRNTLETLVDFKSIRKITGVGPRFPIWVNHVMLSPNKEKFIFIVRTIVNSKRTSYLLLCNLFTGGLHNIPVDGLVSHLNWNDDNHLIGYVKPFGKIANYYKINLNEMVWQNLYKDQETNPDGHPTTISNNILLTDTYPNKFRIQSLYYICLESKKKEILYQEKIPFKFSDMKRCDFHPKLFGQNRVYIDTVKNGVRKQIKIQLNEM